MKRAIIVGVNGQDGSYLAEHLLELGYAVWGIIRRTSSENLDRLDQIDKSVAEERFEIKVCDVTDISSMSSVFDEFRPDEVYNLAAQSDVRISFTQPIATAQITALGALNILEAIRSCALTGTCKFYQASSSEIFGQCIDNDGYQRESTPMIPRSPYGSAKLYAYNLCRNYREAYGMFAVNGILFNHESYRRGMNFVTNKVCRAAAMIAIKKQKRLSIGNIHSSRDWGHAADYVRAMQLMLQLPKPMDLVCATGKTYTVEYLLETAFTCVGLNWKKYTDYDKSLERPAEVDMLRGDASRLTELTGWHPKYSFIEMIDEMVDYWIGKEGN